MESMSTIGWVNFAGQDHHGIGIQDQWLGLYFKGTIHIRIIKLTLRDKLDPALNHLNYSSASLSSTSSAPI